MARPTKYSPETAKDVLDTLSLGCSRKAAAEAAGIDQDTLANWMRRYSDFSAAVLRTEAEVERSAVVSVRKAWMAGDWKAAIEWLKRRRPKEWGDVTRHEIVNMVREMARATNGDEDAAVAEAESYLKEMRRGARS